LLRCHGGERGLKFSYQLADAISIKIKANTANECPPLKLLSHRTRNEFFAQQITFKVNAKTRIHAFRVQCESDFRLECCKTVVSVHITVLTVIIAKLFTAL
ncbi:hypothetical protein GJAV_G00220950, partial [Gymnothorax javanicus]